MSVRLMIGARAAGTRRGDDFHETPECAVHALLAVERFHGSIWEPCCGRGAISRVLESAGHEVISTDHIDRGYGQGRIDFLLEWQPRAPNIITNPPFKLAAPFARNAVRLTTHKVALLCRLAWLETRERAQLFAETPLARVWVFADRLPMMHRCGYDGRKLKNSPTAYAWFVFDHAHSGAPTLGSLR
jgi:hypothetical protein